MPNCNFYAAGQDHRAIFEFLISQGDCEIFESYSRYESELKQFYSITDFEHYFSIIDWNVGPKETMHLQLYPKNAKGNLLKQRIALKPSSCDGATFRYRMQGWGLVQLYLEPIPHSRYSESHTNHNSRKRAEGWSDLIPELGDPADWDWKCVESFSRRLNRFIHKMAVRKVGSSSVLPQASQLLKLV